MTGASQYVDLFEDAHKAASAIGQGVDGVIGIAGSARNLWNDPGYQTVSAFCANAPKSVGQVHGAIAAAEQLPALVRRMAGLLDVSGAPTQLPALPARLASSVVDVATSATNAASHATSLGHAAGATLSSLVPGLSLGVGLLNLGVGVYSAVQIRRVGVRLEALHEDVSTGFQRVDESLAWQSHQIARLVAGQASMHVRLERLRQEISAGFDRVEASVQGVEERRITDEYHEKVAVLTNRYRKVNEALAEGAEPRASDLHRLLDAGEQLDAWVGAQLKRHKIGDPVRLPYLVAQAFAARACADARAIEDGRPSVDRDIARLVGTISQEVFALCDGHSLYWIGVEVPEVITQYVYLARGLVMGQLFGCSAASDDIALFDTPWDDGLEPLRAVACLPLVNEPGWIPLGTLSDLDWFTRWSGGDAEATDLRSVRAVDLLEVARSVGLPGRPERLTRVQSEALLAIALPTFRDQALARLMLAFNWTRAPKLATRANVVVDRPSRASTLAVEVDGPVGEQAVPKSKQAATGTPSTAAPEDLEEPGSPHISPPGFGRPANGDRWGVAIVPKGVFNLQGAGGSVAVAGEGTSEVNVLSAGDRVIVGAHEGVPMQGKHLVPFRVLTSGAAVSVVHRGGETAVPLTIHIKKPFPPPIEERLSFVGVLTNGKGLFAQALNGIDAISAASAPDLGKNLKDITPDQVKFLFTWPYRFQGEADCGLALGGTGGCIWSPGALYGIDARSFRYDTRTGPEAAVWWKYRHLNVGTVVFYAAPDTDEGMALLSTLAAILAVLGLSYHEHE